MNNCYEVEVFVHVGEIIEVVKLLIYSDSERSARDIVNARYQPEEDDGTIDMFTVEVTLDEGHM